MTLAPTRPDHPVPGPGVAVLGGPGSVLLSGPPEGDSGELLSGHVARWGPVPPLDGAAVRDVIRRSAARRSGRRRVPPGPEAGHRPARRRPSRPRGECLGERTGQRQGHDPLSPSPPPPPRRCRPRGPGPRHRRGHPPRPPGPEVTDRATRRRHRRTDPGRVARPGVAHQRGAGPLRLRANRRRWRRPHRAARPGRTSRRSPSPSAAPAGLPTVVSNVETVAHVAVAARLGAEVWRAPAVPGAPGTRLVTVTGAVAHPGTVLEVVGPVRVGDLLVAAGLPAPPAAVLVGGFAGTWVDGNVAWSTPFDRESLRPSALRRAAAWSPSCRRGVRPGRDRPHRPPTWRASRRGSAGPAWPACPVWPPPWTDWPPARSGAAGPGVSAGWPTSSWAAARAPTPTASPGWSPRRSTSSRTTWSGTWPGPRAGAWTNPRCWPCPRPRCRP